MQQLKIVAFSLVDIGQKGLGWKWTISEVVLHIVITQ